MKGLVNFLDQRTLYGRRDHALLLVAVQTGLRLSELTGLRREDMQPGTAAHVRCPGKGRRVRCTPLTKQAEVAMKAWLLELPKSRNWLFPNAQAAGSGQTRSSVCSRNMSELLVKPVHP